MLPLYTYMYCVGIFNERKEDIMRFPNAHAGVQRVFTGEILKLIGGFLTIIGLIMTLAALGASSAENAVATGGFAAGALFAIIPAGILEVVGEVMILLGWNTASKDDPVHLKRAFYLSIGALVMSVVNGSISSASVNDFNICELLTELLSIASLFESIQGINELTRRVNRPDITKLGTLLVKLLIAGIVAALVATIAQNTIGGIVAILAMIVLLAMYVMYIIYLARARDALSR